MNRLPDPDQRAAVVADSRPKAPAEAAPKPRAAVATRPSQKVRRDLPPTRAPYPQRIVRDVPQLAEIWSYLNPQMLYVKHLGFRGNFERRLSEREPKALELHEIVRQIQAEAADFMKVRAVWRFFDAESRHNTISLFESGADTPLHCFSVPRQTRVSVVPIGGSPGLVATLPRTVLLPLSGRSSSAMSSSRRFLATVESPP